MRQCLTSDLGGYYTAEGTEDRDQFGSKGDFVTSPEISQVFGELIGVWFVAEWMSQGKKSKDVYLMEVGPGRGTLMDDMLRTIKNFPEFINAIEAVYLVEASPTLRRAQHKLLCGGNALEKSDTGYQSKSKHSDKLNVVWAEDVRFIPKDSQHCPFIVAHEFFDALPIHIFQSVPPAAASADGETIPTPTGPIPAPRRSRSTSQHQWRELVVSPKPPHRLKDGEPEFELSVAKAATPHAMYLPDTSARYKALQQIDSATIEISPESQAYVRDFAVRLGGSNPVTAPPSNRSSAQSTRTVSPRTETESVQKDTPSGAVLIVDYGLAETIPTNSLRGIRSHQRVSPFLSPGTTDVSADVDFMALAESAINASPGVEVHGPVDQARFLRAMGIEERAAQLVKQAVDKERGGATGHNRSELTELVNRIDGGWKRLVDIGPSGMGRLYQVMAILPYREASAGQPRRRPVGFGGDVTT